MARLVYAGVIGSLVCCLLILVACAQLERKTMLKQDPEAKSPAGKESYVIGAEDVLYIHVWEEDALSRAVPVRMDGNISLPLIRSVKAAGLTPLELEAAITERLKGFYENPNVSVAVMETNSFKVYITGEVNKQGVYRLQSQTTILQMIAMAGGFTEWAKEQRKMFVVRKENGGEKRFTVDYEKAVKGDDPGSNLILKAGDIVVVEASVWEKPYSSPPVNTGSSRRSR